MPKTTLRLNSSDIHRKRVPSAKTHTRHGGSGCDKFSSSTCRWWSVPRVFACAIQPEHVHVVECSTCKRVWHTTSMRLSISYARGSKIEPPAQKKRRWCVDGLDNIFRHPKPQTLKPLSPQKTCNSKTVNRKFMEARPF